MVDLWLNDHVSIAFNQIGILAMSYFFTVTGFLLFSGLSYGKIPSKIKKRVKTLLIPYIVWELIATCYYVALGRVFSFGTWVSTVFLFNTWPPDGALWYVYTIFILACCSYVLLPLLSNSRIRGVVVFISFFACYFFLQYEQRGYFEHCVLRLSRECSCLSSCLYFGSIYRVAFR